MSDVAAGVALPVEPPPERLGRLPEHLREAERLLRDWGWWARTQANRAPNALSGETIGYRLIREGPWGAGQGAQRPENPNHRLLIADALVSQLVPATRRDIVEVVYRDAPHRCWTQEVQAKILHLSVATLKLELTVIREVVRGRMDYLARVEHLDIS